MFVNSHAFSTVLIHCSYDVLFVYHWLRTLLSWISRCIVFCTPFFVYLLCSLSNRYAIITAATVTNAPTSIFISVVAKSTWFVIKLSDVNQPIMHRVLSLVSGKKHWIHLLVTLSSVQASRYSENGRHFLYWFYTLHCFTGLWYCWFNTWTQYGQRVRLSELPSKRLPMLYLPQALNTSLQISLLLFSVYA